MVIDAMVPMLNVEDIDRSIGFYTTVLPFQVAQTAGPSGDPSWALLQAGAVKLMLNKSARAGSRVQSLRPSGTDAVLVLTVDSVREAQAMLAAKGAAVGDIAHQPYGMEEIRLRDPDGYELAIASPMMRIA